MNKALEEGLRAHAIQTSPYIKYLAIGLYFVVFAAAYAGITHLLLSTHSADHLSLTLRTELLAAVISLLAIALLHLTFRAQFTTLLLSMTSRGDQFQTERVQQFDRYARETLHKDKIVNRFLEIVTERFKLDTAVVYQYDSQQNQARRLGGVGGGEAPETLDGNNPLLQDLTRKPGLMISKQPLLTGATCYPLIANGQFLGFVALQRKHRPLKEGEQLFLCSLGDNLATWLFASNSFGQLGERSASLEKLIRSYEDEIKQSSLDSVSGLYHRMAFIQYLSHTFSAAVRYKKPLAVVMLDLKSGDGLPIKAISQIVAQTIRQSDIAAAWADDQLIVALQDTDYAGATVLAKRLVEKIAATAPQVTTTSAIAGLEAEDRNIEQLISRAHNVLSSYQVQPG